MVRPASSSARSPSGRGLSAPITSTRRSNSRARWARKAGARSPPIVEVPHGSPTLAPPTASPSMSDDEVVAFLNGRPITRREVADRALAVDGKNLIDQFIRWRVRGDRVKELGIVNTDDEL